MKSKRTFMEVCFKAMDGHYVRVKCDGIIRDVIPQSNLSAEVKAQVLCQLGDRQVALFPPENLSWVRLI